MNWSKEFNLIHIKLSDLSISLNKKKLKNYLPYSAIVQHLWPAITNEVIGKG